VQELAKKLVGAESPERLNQRQRLLFAEGAGSPDICWDRGVAAPSRRPLPVSGNFSAREQMRDLSTQVCRDPPIRAGDRTAGPRGGA
jgi:hypothetical protein